VRLRIRLHSTEGFEDFLAPTKFCDCDNQEIIKKAKELTENDNTPKEAALSIFHFLRDKIPYLVNYIVKASETLKTGQGFCITKSNLQVALLRAINIPARYHHAYLKKEVLKDIVPVIVYENMQDIITFHPWCECYLSKKWISCDTTFDKALVEALYKKNLRSKNEIPSIHWDGENDLNTMNTWMVEDKGTHESLDNLFLEIQKDWNNTPIENYVQMNQYINNVRKI